MKNKKLIFIILILIIIIAIVCFTNKNEENEKIIETIQKTAEVTNQTIIETLSAPGEVKSAVTENLTLNTGYSFLTLCTEKQELVKKGENLLKYTNGTYLTAPYDCVITDYSVPTVKEACKSSNYVSISSIEDLYMDINIGEEEIDNVSVGQEVDIVVNYDESKTYKGSIEKINAIGTYSNGNTKFAAIAKLKNDGNLKLGMSANCTITLEKHEDLQCLPIEAISIENEERYVNIQEADGTLEKVVVETGKSDANYVEILSGVNIGDSVIYETTTVTNISKNENESKNGLSSLFNMGGPGNRGGFGR